MTITQNQMLKKLKNRKPRFYGAKTKNRFKQKLKPQNWKSNAPLREFWIFRLSLMVWRNVTRKLYLQAWDFQEQNNIIFFISCVSLGSSGSYIQGFSKGKRGKTAIATCFPEMSFLSTGQSSLRKKALGAIFFSTKQSATRLFRVTPRIESRCALFH